MADKELKRLSRKELLELLIEQEKENEELQAALQESQAALDDRTIQIKTFGSVAQAALTLNGVYEAADAAAKQYLDNAKRIAEEAAQKRDEMLADAKVQAQAIRANAEKKAASVTKKAQKTADDAEKKAAALLQKAQTKADDTVSKAQAKAADMTDKAKAKADTVLANAKAKAAEILANAKEKAKAAAVASRSGGAKPSAKSAVSEDKADGTE